MIASYIREEAKVHNGSCVPKHTKGIRLSLSWAKSTLMTCTQVMISAVVHSRAVLGGVYQNRYTKSSRKKSSKYPPCTKINGSKKALPFLGRDSLLLMTCPLAMLSVILPSLVVPRRVLDSNFTE